MRGAMQRATLPDYNGVMAGHECYHCKQWVEEGEDHDCWTTTEAALTRDLREDLQDAWERLRETAAALGEQRIYASHHSIMFSRKSCYFFVRPKRSFLEVCVFLGRPVKAPQVRRVVRSSRSKVANIIQVRHRDEVEAPLTDWIEEAYHFVEARAPKSPARRVASKAAPAKTRSAPGARAREPAPPRVRSSRKPRRRLCRRAIARPVRIRIARRASGAISTKRGPSRPTCW